MLDIDTLKDRIHRKLPQLDKLLLLLASINAPTGVAEIRAQALKAGLRIEKWNASSALSRSAGLAIRVPAGWELSQAGWSHLEKYDVTRHSSVRTHAASSLRIHLEKIADTTTRSFAEEAILCYEAGLFRSATVMSWIAAIDVLYKHTHKNRLTDFNTEAKRRNSRWKDAVSPDDMALMGERDCLDILSTISVIGKSVKLQLLACLDRRNGCGHPNSLRVGESAVAAHLETLLQNVFEPFS